MTFFILQPLKAGNWHQFSSLSSYKCPNLNFFPRMNKINIFTFLHPNWKIQMIQVQLTVEDWMMINFWPLIIWLIRRLLAVSHWICLILWLFVTFTIALGFHCFHCSLFHCSKYFFILVCMPENQLRFPVLTSWQKPIFPFMTGGALDPAVNRYTMCDVYDNTKQAQDTYIAALRRY